MMRCTLACFCFVLYVLSSYFFCPKASGIMVDLWLYDHYIETQKMYAFNNVTVQKFFILFFGKLLTIFYKRQLNNNLPFASLVFSLQNIRLSCSLWMNHVFLMIFKKKFFWYRRNTQLYAVGEVVQTQNSCSLPRKCAMESFWPRCREKCKWNDYCIFYTLVWLRDVNVRCLPCFLHVFVYSIIAA